MKNIASNKHIHTKKISIHRATYMQYARGLSWPIILIDLI